MKWIKLGEIIEITKGKKHTLIEDRSEFSKRVIFTEDLRSDDNIKYTNDELGVFAEKSDILIAWDGANAGLIEFGKSGFIGSTIGRIRIKKQDKYYPPFIGAILKKQFNYFQRTAKGAFITHINRKVLINLRIPDIPYIDQYRIAKVLSKFRTLINKRKRSIKLLDDLTLSTYYKLLSSKSIDYKEIPLVKLKQVAKNIRTGPLTGSLKHNDFTPTGDVGVLDKDNAVKNKFEWKVTKFITYEKYEKVKNHKIYPRDIVFTITGTVGVSGVVPNDIPLAISTKNLAAITLDESLVNPYFISYAIHSSNLVKQQLSKRNKGANIGIIEIIKELRFKIPPISYQNKFEFICREIGGIKEKYEDSLKLLERLYISIENKVLLGEVNLNTISIEGLERVTFINEEININAKSQNLDIVSILKSKSGEELSVNELFECIKKSGLQDLSDHEEIKNVVFSLLRGPFPILSQYFDEQKNEVVLKVN